MEVLIRGTLVLLMIVVVMSCDGNPFLSNLFRGADSYLLPSFKDGDIDDVIDAAEDDDFIDTLAEEGNKEKADDIVKILNDKIKLDDGKDKIGTPPAKATKKDQEAAILLAKVHLARTGADRVVKNDDLLKVVEDSGDLKEPGDVLKKLYKVEDTSVSKAKQKEDVKKQLLSFLAAEKALKYYGKAQIEGKKPPEEVNKGDLASKALVVGMVKYFTDNMDPRDKNQREKDEADGKDPPAPLLKDLAVDKLVDAIVLGTELPPMVDKKDSGGGSNSPHDQIKAMIGPELEKIVNDGLDLSKLKGTVRT